MPELRPGLRRRSAGDRSQSSVFPLLIRSLVLPDSASEAVEAATTATATAIEAAIGEAAVPALAGTTRLAQAVEVRIAGVHVLPAAAGILLPPAAVVSIDVAVRAGIDVVAVMGDAIGVRLPRLAVRHRRCRLAGAAAVIGVSGGSVLDIGAGAGVRVVALGAAIVLEIAGLRIVG